MKEYKIESVTDIAKIPADRMDAFYEDLKVYVSAVRDAPEMLQGIIKNTGMVWCDDGEVGIKGLQVKFV